MQTHVVKLLLAISDGDGEEAAQVLVELSRLSGVHGLRPPAAAIRDDVTEIFASSLKTSPGGILAAAIEAKEFTALLPKRATGSSTRWPKASCACRSTPSTSSGSTSSSSASPTGSRSA